MGQFQPGTKGRLLLVLLGAMVLAVMIVSVRPIGALDFDSFNNCSSDWYVTGYFTPVEKDYASPEMHIIYVPGIGNMTYNSNFLNDVAREGWGKTHLGWYIGFYDNSWHKSPSPLAANGQPLTIGMVATDPRRIPPGASLSINTLPQPWNSSTFRATDTGSNIFGKHIDVYTGEGRIAQTKSFEISGKAEQVCLVANSVLPLLHNNSIPPPLFPRFMNHIAPRITCYCVIFRMDDVQDYWITQGQLMPMDLFLTRNQSLSLGLIMHMVGNDSSVMGLVREGYQKGLFELALHGWDHVDYSKLSEQQQQNSLEKANEKMKYMFGTKSKIFIPPYDPYNNDTLRALSRLDIPIISSFAYEEANLDQNRSIFVAEEKAHSNDRINQTIYHIPGTIPFKQYLNGTWVKTPMSKILNDLSYDIKSLGYAVIVLHPQDFVKTDRNGTLVNILDRKEINDLSFLLDYVSLKKIHVTSFSGLVRKWA